MNEFPTFTFNGLNSYTDFGIVITEMPPIFFPKRDIESIRVEGSNKILHVDKGAYLPATPSIKCILLDTSKLDQLKLLFKATGEIEFSDNPDRIYRCTVTNQIDFSKYCGISKIREFPLQLELESVAYSKKSKELIFTYGDTFNVDGTENTYPIITVKGTGIVTLNNMKVQFLESEITLDCEMMEAVSNNLSKNDKVIADDFPYLVPGQNQISISGEVESVNIVYKERWL